MRCDMNCLECSFKDCINGCPATEEERRSASERDKECHKVTGIDMTRYIHNRIDKEEYQKARDREYDRKRAGTPKRKEQKRKQYLRHRDSKLAYQNTYYKEHKEECLARSKAHYEAHKEEINMKCRVVNEAIEVYGDYSLRKIKGRYFIKSEQGEFYAHSLDEINWSIRTKNKHYFCVYAHPQDVVKQLVRLNKGGTERVS